MPRNITVLPRRSPYALITLLTAVLVVVSAPALAASGSAATTRTADAPRVPRTQQQDAPFLFGYVFNGHLKLAGGNFTVGGTVYLVVRDGGGKVFSRKVVARPHAVTPGGAIYVETPIYAPCARNNGYAQAYDYTTGRWTRQLPVGVCKSL